MNIQQKQMHKSQFRNAAPPGSEATAPEPKERYDDAVELRFNESGPETGLGLWQKVIAGTMAGIAGVTAVAPQAQAAPAEALVTQQISQTDGMEVTVLPKGAARVDILRQTRTRFSTSRTRNDETNVPYTEVGVHLGRGIFHDSNGNLSLVPSLAAGWEDGVSDFSRVEIEQFGFDDVVTRYGDTVHHKENPYERTVYVERVDGEMDVHNDDAVNRYEVLENGLQYRTERGLEWRITQDGNTLQVDGPSETDFTLTYSGNSIEVLGRERGHDGNVIVHSPTSINVRGEGNDYNVTRSVSGGVTDVEQSGPFNDTTIVRQGNVIRMGDREITVNPSEFMNSQEINFNELTRLIEEAEPGYAERHPLVMGLLEYATANPGLVGEDEAGNEVFLDVGKGIATGGGALQSGVALLQGSTALSLAENARALGASAAAAQAAAQSAAAGGNLAQAAALGAEARNLAGQAQALGSEARALGDTAAGTARVARVMTGVAGALEVIDGGTDLHRGASGKSVVEGAIIMTEALRERLSTELEGREYEQMMEDYSKVMQILNGLKQNANKQIRIGGIKIGCGGLMLISALAGGGVIPPIIGAVGMVCTAGTSVYENWDQLEAFFTGTEVEPDPTLRDVLPGSLQETDLFKVD